MLSALALAVMQRPAYATFAKFVDESGKAILGVAQGTWWMAYRESGPKTSFVVQGNSAKEVYERNGKPQAEYVVNTNFATAVDHEERTFSQATFAEYRGEWVREALDPMKDEGIDLRLTTDRGLVLRANPSPGSARVVVESKTETLFVGVRRKDGKLWRLQLSRDAKTELPIQFQVVEGDEGRPQIAGFAFERREVLPFELTIDENSYEGYRQIPFRSGPSR